MSNSNSDACLSNSTNETKREEVILKGSLSAHRVWLKWAVESSRRVGTGEEHCRCSGPQIKDTHTHTHTETHTETHTHTHTHTHTRTRTHSALRNDLCFGPSRVTEIALLSRWHKSISDSLHFSLYKHQHVSAGNCWQLWRAHRVKKRKQKYTWKSNVKEWRRVRSALKNR